MPYMEGQAVQPYEVTLRGFSPRELVVRAQRQCASHFGDGGFCIEQATCYPCVCSLGGRVRLYEARVIASGSTPN